MSLLTPLFIPKMYCSIVGHQYRIEKNITKHIKEYKCSCCGKEVTINAHGNIVPLTPELKYIHQGLSNMVLKRRNNQQRIVKTRVA